MSVLGLGLPGFNAHPVDGELVGVEEGEHWVALPLQVHPEQLAHLHVRGD